MSIDDLIPANDSVLVELGEKSEIIATIEGKYDTKTNGQCLKVGLAPHSIYEPIGEEGVQNWPGKTVFWDAYKDDCKVTIDGKDYAFVKISEIRGYAKTN